MLKRNRRCKTAGQRRPMFCFWKKRKHLASFRVIYFLGENWVIEYKYPFILTLFPRRRFCSQFLRVDHGNRTIFFDSAKTRFIRFFHEFQKKDGRFWLASSSVQEMRFFHAYHSIANILVHGSTFSSWKQ